MMSSTPRPWPGTHTTVAYGGLALEGVMRYPKTFKPGEHELLPTVAREFAHFESLPVERGRRSGKRPQQLDQLGMKLLLPGLGLLPCLRPKSQPQRRRFVEPLAEEDRIEVLEVHFRVGSIQRARVRRRSRQADLRDHRGARG